MAFSSQGTSKSLNVLGTPLKFFSLNPPTGFMRNGFCDTNDADQGTHTIAAEVTAEWLDYSAKQGNDLKTPRPGFEGLKPGCKWCLCVSRWQEAFQARKSDDDKVVPRLWLEMSHQKSLKTVDLDTLKKFAIDKDKIQGQKQEL